jgi:hypothetical protein
LKGFDLTLAAWAAGGLAACIGIIGIEPVNISYAKSGLPIAALNAALASGSGNPISVRLCTASADI